MSKDYAQHWVLDGGVTFLNHGSFGACPRVVQEVRQGWRDRLERQPVHFLMRDIEGALDEARVALAGLLGAEAGNLAFVTNATTGVNTVLRSLKLERDDEVLVTSQGYNACNNAARFVTERVGGGAGGGVTVAEIPFPIESPDEALEAVITAVTDRTRLAVIDHVTSATALVLPIEKIVRALEGRGVEVLVDGAHAPGMVGLELEKLGASYYTGNCHKWLCGPKSAAFLYVRPDRQEGVRPLVISHGMNSSRTDRSRFLLEFDWMGTTDPTPILAIPSAIEFLGGLLPGGLDALMAHNRGLALLARGILCEALGIPAPCPDAMIGSMATVPLPDEAPHEDFPPTIGPTLNPVEPLQNALLERYGIEVPITTWPRLPKRQLRVSAQIYNHEQQYRDLAAALKQLFHA